MRVFAVGMPTTELDSPAREDFLASMASRGGPFQTLVLTADEQQSCHDRAFALLDRTLRSYDERDGQTEGSRLTAPLHHSNLDSARWKLLKTTADASIYAGRAGGAHLDHNLLGGDWQNPVVLLMAGTIRGDLDDVMLGIETPDTCSYRTRMELYTKQPLDGAVLSELQGPSDADPFRFLGVTWMMYEYNWPLKTLIRPRDFVTLISTGIMTRANGDRVGYEVVLPARLSKCPPLPGAVVRGTVMYAAIFKQQEPGVVDTFVRTYVEAQGSFLDKVVVSMTWKATICFWDAPQLAEMKKLQWCIANARSQRQTEQARASSPASSICWRCYDTRRMMKRISAGTLGGDVCVLCSLPTCSKCTVQKTLKVIAESTGGLKDRVVLVCRPGIPKNKLSEQYIGIALIVYLFSVILVTKNNLFSKF
jgi:hypothetical protein